MRSYEEMAQRVLTRGEAIREQQQKRRKILLGTASGLIVCGLAALLVLEFGISSLIFLRRTHRLR